MIYFIYFTLILSALAGEGDLVCQVYNGTACLLCVPSYYKNTTQGYCRLCQDIIPGCLTCQSTTSTNLKASCYQCSEQYDRVQNKTDNSYYCISCPQGMYYDSVNSQCNICQGATTIGLCKRCATADLVSPFNCKQCNQGYYLAQNSTCVVLSTPFDLNVARTPAFSTQQKMFFAKQYLLALLPIFKYPVDNLRSLSRVCTNNGYSCQCISTNTTSRCSNFTLKQSILNLYTNLTSISFADTSYDFETLSLAAESIIEDQSKTLNLISTIDTFVQPTVTLSKNTIKNMFKLLSKLSHSKNTYASLSTVIKQLASQLFVVLQPIAPSNTTAMVMYGNQYVMKLSSFKNKATLASMYGYKNFNTSYATAFSGYDYLFMIFNRSAFNMNFTGTLLYGNSITPTSLNLNITIPYLSSLAPVQTYKLLNPVTQIYIDTSAVNLSNGLFTFNYSSGINSNLQVAINSTQVKNVIDYHFDIRVENLFYRSAFFYLLFFVLLYLIFIPLCTFYDMVKDNKSRRYKSYVVRERGGTMQDIRVTEENIPAFQHNPENSQINYKQFFPIYNIAATQNRPQRLLKLCLFLLNLQTPTTILVVLYVNVPKQAVWAILLAIPAYFICIVIGYIYGAFKKWLRGKWKWAFNVVPVGYWVIWFVLMPKMMMNDFPLYIIIFSVVLVVLDIVIDALQCLAMYFIIKQQNPIYDCLAPVLAYRGYFDYDKYNTG